MTPEELLQQTSVANRINHQQKQVKQQKIRSRQNPHAVALPYDGDRGSQQIQLSDGSVREAETNSNGVIGVGDTVALHQGKGRSRINVMPHKPRQAPQAAVPQSEATARFWLLMDNDLYEMVVRGSTAIANRLCNAEDFPAPYDLFHGGEPGLARISDTEFYLPRYSGIHKYNIATKTATTVAGATGRSTSGFSYTYSCCSLPDKTAFVAVEDYEITSNEFLIRINPDGSIEESAPYTTEDEGAWSIAAVDRSTIYLVTDYGLCSRFNFETGERVNLFQNKNTTYTTSIFGDVIDGKSVLEVTYAYADPVTKNCYVSGTVQDNDESLPDYIISGAQVIGDAPESTFSGEPMKIISGNLPSHAIPGDDAGNLRIHKIINDSTFYGYGDNGAYWQGAQDLSVNLRRRRFRSVIWQITPDGNVSTYFLHSAADTRETATGYRYHYNLPARGAIFDPKTKQIFIHGLKEQVVQSGKYLGNRYSPQDKPLVRLTKAKQFQPLLVKPGKNAPADFDNRWFWFSQLEPI